MYFVFRKSKTQNQIIMIDLAFSVIMSVKRLVDKFIINNRIVNSIKRKEVSFSEGLILIIRSLTKDKIWMN